VYQRILVAIEHSAADQTILAHVQPLARLTHARLLLLHVADGWAARAYDELQLRESEEMREDREYLGSLAASLRTAGFDADWRLARGDPATQIIRTAGAEHVDLVAMATHGHRLLSDLVHGTTVNRVRHELQVPVLLLRAK
jgi:nucleotide-binding universal stress UspA family protein